MRFEWPTLLLLIVTYALWALGTTVVYAWSPLLGIVLTGVAITQHSSLQHEALHGHPFHNRLMNEALVFPGLSLTVPYRRFLDTHLAHHNDPVLTDPYDDPESCYFDPAVWVGLPAIVQKIMILSNTLLGRMVLGPIIGNTMWLWSEALQFKRNAPRVRLAWVLHGLGLIPVIAWVWGAAMPFWAYLLAVWIGHGILKIRTFLEHRAHLETDARTVIIEDRGPLALLFLNNNFHAVHHLHPKIKWYALPGVYAAGREAFLKRNDGYAYTSYAQVFKHYFLHTKEPLAHPFYSASTGLDSRSVACDEAEWNSGSSPQ
jgi:fatty acid desaturase